MKVMCLWLREKLHLKNIYTQNLTNDMCNLTHLFFNKESFMPLFCKNLLCIFIGCFFVISAQVDAAFTPVGNAKPIHEGFVTRFTDITPNVVVAKAPPASLAEKIPEKPAKELIWIDGYWAWIVEKNEYVWICGIHRRFPPDHVWIKGNWIQQQGGWVWERGFWSKVPLEKVVYIEKSPPSTINDNPVQAPGNDYFWAPGYWDYTPATQNYGWLTGKWQQLNPKWILAPATYTWRHDGFVFTSLFWDWHLVDRGLAYSCSDNKVLVAMQPDFICQQIFCCYPDYLVLYCHCWHYYPGWWSGCGCIPSWWNWTNWWSFSWSNNWGLWWWWTHGPGPAPIWLTKQMSQGISPAPQSLIKVFAMKMPKLDIQFGTEVLAATGLPNGKELPLPTFTITVTPTGGVTLPELPGIVLNLPWNPGDKNRNDENQKQVQIPDLPENSESENTQPFGDFDNDAIREGGLMETQQQTEFPSNQTFPSVEDQFPSRGHERPYPHQDGGSEHYWTPALRDSTPKRNTNSGGSSGGSSGNNQGKGRGR